MYKYFIKITCTIEYKKPRYMCFDYLILQVEVCRSYDLLILQVMVYAMMFWPINVMSGGMIFWPIYSRWEGEGVNEVGKDKKTGEVRVKVNPKFYRPTEVVRVASLCSVYKIMLSDSDLLNFIERAHFYLFKIKILTLIGIWLGCNCQGEK